MKINGFEIEPESSFKPNKNPFTQDCSRMGKRIDDNLMAMYDMPENNDYIILVHIPTGKRISILVPKYEVD